MRAHSSVPRRDAASPSVVRVLVAGRTREWSRRVQGLLPRWSVSEIAEGAAAAFALLLSGPWDIILCDLELPDARPLELFRVVRALRPDTSERIVWLCSASGTVHEPFLASVSHFVLYEPFDARELEDVLARVRSSRRPEGTP